MKKHLKRLAAPKSWAIARKGLKFLTRPAPGGHSMEASMPLSVIFRDLLKHAVTARESMTIIKNKTILIDGKQTKEPRRQVGLMDVLKIPETNETYRMIINRKGKLELKTIPAEEENLKVCRINSKSTISKGKIQLGLHDGRTIISDAKYNTGDSLLLKLPGQEIAGSFPLEKNTIVFLSGGKHKGSTGTIEEIRKQLLVVRIGDETVETLKKFAFAIGKEKPAITV
ncbi:30S ribosomal protein S4e [Candidatus Woesearchaeota archaeon]|nr:30S ribosomal protein S4e [Candidatus Woesearchaeota archaeon]